MKFDILYCFYVICISWFMTWACLLQLIQLYAKKTFLAAPLGVKRSDIVIALSLYHGVNAFLTLRTSLLVWTFLIFVCCQFLLCCILWEASGENMFTVPLACGYSYYWPVYDSVSYLYLDYIICSDILLIVSINGFVVLLPQHCFIAFFF